MPTADLYESMLFNYETTNRTDFQQGYIVSNVPRTVYKEKSRRIKTSPLEVKDTQTLSVWKTLNVPFGMFTNPKEIVRENLEKIQIDCMKPVAEIKESDEERKKVQATRPRLVMPPALSMDDIENPKAREILIEDVYKSSIQRMQQKVYADRDCSYRAPLNGRLTTTDPIKLPKVKVPYVSPEWRMESVQWDSRNVRGYADPTKEFWLRRVPMCRACDVTAAVEAQRKIKKHK